MSDVRSGLQFHRVPCVRRDATEARDTHETPTSRMADIRGDIRHRDTNRDRDGHSASGHRLAQVVIQMSDRKKPGVTFWATVVLVVGLAVYVLSWGPACWYIDRNQSSAGVLRLYRPLVWLAARCGHPVVRAFWDYAGFGAVPTSSGFSTGQRWLTDEEYRYRHLK